MTLPLELWWAVCTVNVVPAVFPYIDSAVYSVLVRAARRFAIPNAKALFIRKKRRTNGYAFVLPNGRNHSVGGRPALISIDTEWWYADGKLHRVGLPAAISPGVSTWCENGIARRGPLPFLIMSTGTQAWVQGNKIEELAAHVSTLCRISCMVVNENGIRCWNFNEKIHRDGLPALIHQDGSQHWCQNGEWYRPGLPAAIFVNGRQVWDEDSVHKVDKIRAGWFDDWHERGMFLDINYSDI